MSSTNRSWGYTREATAEDRQAVADAQQLRALAGDYDPEDFAPGYRNPEASRGSREQLVWLSQHFASADTYRARTWGYTILRTTYADDAAFDAAVSTLDRYMRAMADRECWRVTNDLETLRNQGRLPMGAPTTADPRPSDELYVRRFVNDVVQDRAALGEATPTQACAFFRRWALERWHGEEWRFSAAGPRLKTAILFDEETVAQLQGLVAHDFGAGEDPGGEARRVARENWVKMVESEPKQRDLSQGLLEWFRIGFGDIHDFWFSRYITEPSVSGCWKLDDQFPGEWRFTWN